MTSNTENTQLEPRSNRPGSLRTVVLLDYPVALTQLSETLAVLVPQTPPDAQRTPIELAEVQAVVEQTTLAADRLNLLVQSVDRALAPDDLKTRLAQLDLALGRAESRGQSLIDRTFMLAGLLVVLIFAGSVGRILLQRRVNSSASPKGQPAQ